MDIVRCIDKKHDWFRKLKLNLITRRSYNSYCRALRELLSVAEREYYTKKLNCLGNDSKKNWKVLNKMLGRAKTGLSNKFESSVGFISDPIEIANEFCKFFSENPSKINGTIPNSFNNYSSLIPINETTMLFNFCTANEVKHAFKNLKKPGCIDDLQLQFLRLCGDYVCEYLETLFNMCIAEGRFPSCFKLSKIIPLYKKGRKTAISNHRPISIICNLSKIFEDLIKVRLDKSFHDQNLLSDNQFGFREGKSTEHAALTLIHRVSPAIENKAFAICVLLDFSSCFDTVSHELLFTKLSRYGVRGLALDLIRSYFSDRIQVVKFSGKESNKCSQSMGVVQGSKGGRFILIITQMI